MKLVIFGLTISSSWGDGHATIWRGLCRELARRRHTKLFFLRRTFPIMRRTATCTKSPAADLFSMTIGATPPASAGASGRRRCGDSDLFLDGISTADISDAPTGPQLFQSHRGVKIIKDLRGARAQHQFGAAGLRDFDTVIHVPVGTTPRMKNDSVVLPMTNDQRSI